MLILPSIDLKDSKCVRLLKGDFDTVHEVAKDPIAVARGFIEAGAKLVHSVDLDGALHGERKNAAIIKALAQIPGIKLQMGGGIRSMSDLEAVFALGVARCVIGTAAVTNPGFVREAVLKYGERIAVGIDAKDGRVKTRGWVDDSGLDAFEFAVEMENAGVKTLIFTDIDRDGTLTGPPLESLKRLKSRVTCDVIASGGVSCLDDIAALKALGVSGVIVGKAYYSAAVDLKEAVLLGQST